MLPRLVTRAFIALSFASLALGSAAAQVRAVDPNTALDAPAASSAPAARPSLDIDTKMPSDDATISTSGAEASNSPTLNTSAQSDVTPAGDVITNETSTAPATNAEAAYRKDDLIGAAEGVFGKGAQGLAGIIEKILKDQGQPNAYIAGREASGALIVGVRYGSGTMNHSVEGQRPVYWTGPSIGFDAGGDATKVFVLVYNLYDSQDLYKRFPQAEGRAYFVGGFSATYLRRGSVVLIPVRLGVGARLGVNVGYMKFSEKSRWLPF